MYNEYKQDEAFYDDAMMGNNKVQQHHQNYETAKFNRKQAYEARRITRQQLNNLNKQHTAMTNNNKIPHERKQQQLHKLYTAIEHKTHELQQREIDVENAEFALTHCQESWLNDRATFYGDYETPSAYAELHTSIAGRVAQSIDYPGSNVHSLLDIDIPHRQAITQNIYYFMAVITRVLVGLPPMAFFDENGFMTPLNIIQTCINEVDVRDDDDSDSSDSDDGDNDDDDDDDPSEEDDDDENYSTDDDPSEEEQG